MCIVTSIFPRLSFQQSSILPLQFVSRNIIVFTLTPIVIFSICECVLTMRLLITRSLVVVIFIDDLHLRFQNTGRVRELFKKMQKNLVHEGDLFGLVSSGPSSISVDMTYDIKRLEQAIKELEQLEPPDNLTAAQLRNNAAMSYKKLDKLPLAEQHYLRALEVLQAEQGDSEDVASIFKNLGSSEFFVLICPQPRQDHFPFVIEQDQFAIGNNGIGMSCLIGGP